MTFVPREYAELVELVGQGVAVHYAKGAARFVCVNRMKVMALAGDAADAGQVDVRSCEDGVT